MASIFTYVPDRGYTRNTKPKVLVYQFGDGYSQRIPDGLNSIRYDYSLTFNNRSIPEANAIIQFFEGTFGAEYFLWTPPQETTQIKVIASDWSNTYESAISRTVSVNFTQVFDI